MRFSQNAALRKILKSQVQDGFRQRRSLLKIAFYVFLCAVLLMARSQPVFALGDPGDSSFSKAFAQLKNNAEVDIEFPVSGAKLTELARDFDQFQAQFGAQLNAPTGGSNSPEDARSKEFFRLKKYLALRTRFQKCLESHDADGLGNRILAIAKNLPGETADCGLRNTSLLTLATSVQGPLSHDLYLQQEQKLIHQIETNAGRALAEAAYSVQDHPRSLEDIAHAAAASACNSGCSQNVRKQVEAAALQRLQDISARKPMTSQEAADTLNAKISEINSLASTPIHSAFDAVDLARNVEDKYWATASSGAGMLLNTDLLTQKTGEFRHLDGTVHGVDPNAKSRYNGIDGHINYQPLSANLTAFDIQKSLAQYTSKISEMSATDSALESRAVMASRQGVSPADVEKRKAEIESLVKTNPVAAAQVALRDPASAEMVCNMINSIARHETKRQKRQGKIGSYEFWAGTGLAVVGIATASTGVGLLFDGPILVAAADMLTTAPAAAVGLGATVAGGAATSVETVLAIRDAAHANQDIRTITHAQLGANTDQASLRDVQLKESILADKIVNVTQSFGMTAVESTSFIKGLAMVAVQKKEAVLLTNAVKLSKDLGHEEAKATISYLRASVGQAEEGEVLGEIAQLPDTLRGSAIHNLQQLCKRQAKTESLHAFKRHLEDMIESMPQQALMQ